MRWLWLAVPPLLAIALGLATNVASASLPSGVQVVAWPMLAVLAVAAMWQEFRRHRQPGGPPFGGDRVDAAADALAETVRQQWSAELAARGLVAPTLLPSAWASTELDVLPPVLDIIGHGVVAGIPKRMRLRGSVGELVRAFLALPGRQLIILGEPGAGKTILAVRLTLALLATRTSDNTAPVPVVLPISSWPVGEEPLADWVTRRLREDYPALANRERFGSDAATELVARGVVLPVLDGMDELGPGAHAQAVERIDEATVSGESGPRRMPLVMTCRSTEYESAVRSGRRMPATALVVELLPVPELDATAYLSAGRLAGDQRWAPVFAQLRNQPQRPVAQALSTPLMVGLTRLVYAGPDTDASTLLSLTGRADVERCLLDGFLATAYPSDKLPRVLRWLRFVARHLDRQGSHDLAWWELHRALPKHQAARLTGVVLSAATAVISGIAVWLLMAPSGAAGRITAIAVGAAAAVTAALVGPAVAIGAASAVPQRINTQLRFQLNRLVQRLVAGAARGALGGLLVGVIAEISYTTAFDLEDPARLGLWLGLVLGTMTGLTSGVITWLRAPADRLSAADPIATLRADRNAMLVQLVVLMVAFCLSVGVATAIFAGPTIGLLDGAAVALVGVVVALARGPHGWPLYTVTRGCLALTGRIPWRLMRFLTDARRRGVLRESGGVYQFRHALLQDRLAGSTLPDQPQPMPASSRPAAPTGRRPRALRMVALGVVIAVSGTGLGVGLPILGALQTQCGVSLFDPNVHYLRADTSECVGVTDGSYLFGPDLKNDERLIHEENELIRDEYHTRGTPYVRVAVLAPLNVDPRGLFTSAQIRHAVEGAYIAQYRHNRAGTGINIELLLAAEGSKQLHWRPVIDRLIELAAAGDHPLVAVTGLGVSINDTIRALTVLSDHHIPMVASQLNGDGFDGQRIPGLLRISPSNQHYVRALMGALRRRDSVAVVHTDAVNDLYLASLEGAYSAAFPRITRYDRGNTYFSSIVRDICEQNTSVVLYAGGPSYLPELVDALNQRPCGGLAISLATEAVDTSYLQSLSLGTNLRLLCASPVNVNDWAHVAPGTPVGYASFASAYSDRFPDPLDDGYAILHHDATATALDAVTLAYYTINHPPGPADVLIATRQLDRYHPVHGASGTLSFDSAGNPEGKPIPVVQIPKAESPIPLYQTP